MDPTNEGQWGNKKLTAAADIEHIITLIKGGLSKECLETIEKSCFGQFLKVKKQKLQGQLLLHLLFCQDNSRSRDRLVFKIFDKVAEFGPQEFSIITGLAFGCSVQPPNGSQLYSRLFQRRKCLYLADIISRFGDPTCNLEDRTKLGMMLIMYGLLLVKPKTSEKIDIQYIHLLDNMDQFNRFPWGNVAYPLVVNSLRDILDNRDRAGLVSSGTGHNEERIYCSGFVQVIQFWAYEAIPRVASFCAFSVTDGNRLLPRMLRWSSTDRPSIRFIARKVFKQNGDDVVTVYVKIEPSVAELSADYFISAMRKETDSKRKENQRDCTQRIGEKRKTISVPSAFEGPELELCVRKLSERVDSRLGRIERRIQKRDSSIRAKMAKSESRYKFILRVLRRISDNLECVDHSLSDYYTSRETSDQSSKTTNAEISMDSKNSCYVEQGQTNKVFEKQRVVEDSIPEQGKVVGINSSMLNEVQFTAKDAEVAECTGCVTQKCVTQCKD